MQQMPLTGYPVMDTLTGIGKLATTAAVFVKNQVSTGYNIVCQQIDKEGPYYEAFPLVHLGVNI